MYSTEVHNHDQLQSINSWDCTRMTLILDVTSTNGLINLYKLSCGHANERCRMLACNVDRTPQSRFIVAGARDRCWHAAPDRCTTLMAKMGTRTMLSLNDGRSRHLNPHEVPYPHLQRTRDDEHLISRFGRPCCCHRR